MSDIAKRQETALTTNVVQREDAFANEDFLIMPTAKVMQPTSELLQDEDYNFKQGDVVHSLLLEKLPEKFVPISWFQSNIFFLPKNDTDRKQVIKDFTLPEDFNEMFICRSQDGKTVTTSYIGQTTCVNCPYNKFGWDGGKDTPPICTNSLNFLSLFEGTEAPVVIQFGNTSRRAGKDLYTNIKYTGTVNNPYSRAYLLKSTKTQNAKGVYYVLKIKPAGKPDEALFTLAQEIDQQFANQVIVTEDEMMAPQQVEIDFGDDI